MMRPIIVDPRLRFGASRLVAPSLHVNENPVKDEPLQARRMATDGTRIAPLYVRL